MPTLYVLFQIALDKIQKRVGGYDNSTETKDPLSEFLNERGGEIGAGLFSGICFSVPNLWECSMFI